VEIQLTPYVLRDPHQLCTAERSPQALLAMVPPGLEAKVERAFRKLCEALSIAEGSSGALGGWAHRDPDLRHRRRTSIRQASQGDQTFSMKKRQKKRGAACGARNSGKQIERKTLGSGLNAGNIGAEIDVI
jgi:hypothetical protein